MYGIFTHMYHRARFEQAIVLSNHLCPNTRCAVQNLPNQVDRRVTGSNKEVRKLLWAATAPDRMEWLFNNLRVRHAMGAPARALMPSGTASNEALHAEIHSWGTSIRSLHKSTLRLKLCIMHFGKLLAHHVASCYPGVGQTSESVLLA